MLLDCTIQIRELIFYENIFTTKFISISNMKKVRFFKQIEPEACE